VYDFTRYKHWIERGLAGQMGYLADHRAELRSNPSNLLHGARSVISVGLLYNGPEPCSTAFSEPDRAWISRYAWGEDYHTVLRAKLQLLDRKLKQIIEFTSRICVDTAPLLERSLARDAGLGWIGKNTCLINQQQGSWFFLGELITTLDIKPDSPPPDRCGTCTRCIDACPTDALTPYELDARLCISYFTIELRSSIPEPHREQMGSHIFGCDICQDVCPWNRRAPQDRDPAFAPTAFAPTTFAPDLARMAELSEQDFRDLFRRTPVSRAKYAGFLRNVAVAMGNAGLEKFREPLTKLAASPDPTIAEHAQWALDKIERN
jgi:epoxyqueuosine reductase